MTLGNGGSYQKRCPNKDLKDKNHTVLDDDLYDVDLTNDDDPRRVPKRNPQTGVIVTKENEKIYEAKYFKNKHFFMDPFALTIAQWCYVYGMHKNDDGSVPTNEDELRTNARNNLRKSRSEHSGSIGEDNFKQMEESYWKYLSVWEKEEWAQLKEEYKNTSRSGEYALLDDVVEINPSVDARDIETAPVDDDE